MVQLPSRFCCLATLAALATFAVTSACHGPTPAPVTPSLAPAPPSPTTPLASPEAPPAVDQIVDYRLAPVLDGDQVLALAVELRFFGDADGETELRLPDRWAGAKELWRHLRELQIEGASAIVEEGPAARKLRAAPGASITVRYQIVSAYPADPVATDGQPFAPVIRPTWFYAFGNALFAEVVGRDEVPVRFSWTGPEGLPFASDLQHRPAAAKTLAALHDSISMGGRAVALHADRGGLRVAIAGNYAFSPAAFIELADAILTAQRAFFEDAGQPFLITVAPLQAMPGHFSIGGTALADAFALAITTDTPLAELRALIAHETFHIWNPRLLGKVEDPAAELRGKWFSEGFTELYTHRLLLRTGRYSLEDFVAAWNETLRAYGTSPVRDASGERIAADYWNDPEINKLPYRRGQLLAALWDYKLRRATGGALDLDDAMRSMKRRADANRAADDRAALLTPALLFPVVYAELKGPPLDADLERFVVQGQAIELPVDTFGGCVQVVARRQRSFDRGWDAEATNAAGGQAIGVRPGSPAHKAGLRDGMKIVRRLAGSPGDSSVRYTILIEDRGAQRRISFWPRGEQVVSFQRLELPRALPAKARAACTRVLAGQ